MTWIVICVLYLLAGCVINFFQPLLIGKLLSQLHPSREEEILSILAWPIVLFLGSWIAASLLITKLGKLMKLSIIFDLYLKFRNFMLFEFPKVIKEKLRQRKRIATQDSKIKDQIIEELDHYRSMHCQQCGQSLTNAK